MIDFQRAKVVQARDKGQINSPADKWAEHCDCVKDGGNLLHHKAEVYIWNDRASISLTKTWDYGHL